MIEHGRIYRVKSGAATSGNVADGTLVVKASGHDYGCAGEDTRATGVDHVSVEIEGGGGPFFTTPVSNLEPVEAVAVEVVAEGADEEEEGGEAIAAEPHPNPAGAGESVFAEIRADLNAREAKGVATYGESLRTFNGRRMLVDAYQEALDLAVYVKGEIMERRKIARRLASAEAEIEGLAGARDAMREAAITAARAIGALRSGIVALAARNAWALERAGTETGAGGARETAIRSTLADDLRKLLDGSDAEFVISRSVRALVDEIEREAPLADARAHAIARRLSAILAGGQAIAP